MDYKEYAVEVYETATDKFVDQVDAFDDADKANSYIEANEGRLEEGYEFRLRVIAKKLKTYEISYSWKNGTMLEGQAVVRAKNEEEAEEKLNKYVSQVCPGYSYLRGIKKIVESNTVMIL